MRYSLSDIALQLDKWAKESQEGGWSTHQVGPMQRLANDLRRQEAFEKDAGPELFDALVGLVKDIKRKPNDTRYATHVAIAEKAIKKALS